MTRVMQGMLRDELNMVHRRATELIMVVTAMNIELIMGLAEQLNLLWPLQQ